MTNASSPKPIRATSGLRRGLAGLVAATTIAFGGTTLLSSQEAHAAGVRPTTYSHTYAVTTDQVGVRSETTRRTA